MKRKSDYAFVAACNPGYWFALLSTMNAQNYFGTDADWEIAYDGFTDEDRDRISGMFPHVVNWTAGDLLCKEIEDKRLNKSNGLHFQWLSGWVLAHKVLKEKKYKAVCIIQADEFLFVNLNNYFEIASFGKLVCSEVYGHKIKDFRYGDPRNNRVFWFGLFDGLVFIGQEDYLLPKEFLHFHETIDRHCSFVEELVDIHKVESNPLFRDIMTRISNEDIIALNATQWCGDADYPSANYYIENDKVFRKYGEDIIQLYGLHRRWWQWTNEHFLLEYGGLLDLDDVDKIQKLDNVANNINLIKSFQERFNEMIPEIRSEEYVKGRLDWRQ